MNASRFILLALALTGVMPAAMAAAPAARARSVLPFVRDDYTKALAQARARKLPLFIEAWAPW